ncbi:MAG: hypothetical protein Q4A81_04600 [Pasteurellaceae bacterium]|nr:hypothetical protein [Pasteurellaceae bacterium]
MDAIKKERITTGNYNLKSILELSEFYKNNYDSFEKSRKTFKINGKEEFIYPQMKFLDMGLWKIGFDIDNSKKESKS